MMMTGDRNALVIGAGVVGLSAAVRLRERGWSVRVCAAAPPDRTTSAISAALWYPYRVGPADRVPGWGERTYAAFALLAGDPATGVRMVPGIEVLAPGADPHVFPDFAPFVPDFRLATADELPPGRVGWALTLPIADTSVYLRWLAARFVDLGGEVEMRRFDSLDEALREVPLVVNCAGLGARELADDPAMRPVRGQVVRVENPGLRRFWLDDHNPAGLTYIIPRTTDVILGGTDEEGAEDTTPDPAIADAILRRCIAAEPMLASAKVLEHRVGLRPWRPEVRLEVEDRATGRIIHDYGHGGAGVTLSWGCADAVADLADEA